MKRPNTMSFSYQRIQVFVIAVTTLTCFYTVNAQVQAQPFVYVSAVNGLDTNACTRPAPCRDVTRALSMVSPDGTVLIIDSGDYKGFIATKSVSILAAPGISAVFSSSTGPAISLYWSSQNPSVRIHLKGISIVGTGGLMVIGTANSSFDIEDCSIVIRGKPLSIDGPGTFSFRNTLFRGSPMSPYPNENNMAGSSSDRATVVFENCSFEECLTGLRLEDQIDVTLRNSVVTRNSTGVLVNGNSKLYIENSYISRNGGTGVVITSTTAWVRMNNSTITDNGGYGLSNTGGYARTFGNNRITNNGSGNVSGSLVAYALQ